MAESSTTSQTLLQTTITIIETVPAEYSLSQKRTNRFLSNSVDETQDTDNNGVNISTILAQTSIAEQEPQTRVPNDRQQQPGEVHIQIQENIPPSQQNSAAAQRENQQNKILELQNILQKSAEFRFRRALFICITIFIGLFSLEQAMEGDLQSLRGLYIISCSFLGYYLIENIILTVSKDIIPWKRTENLFDTLDIAIFIIFTVCVALKTTNGLDFSVKTICVLPLINLLLYFWKSSAPKTEKRALLLLRFFCVIQAFVLSERIDEDFILPWSGTLFIVWMFLGSLTLCFLFFAGMTIYAIIAGLLGGTMPFEMDKKVQIKGLGWVTIYSSLGVVAFLGFVADVNEKKELIKLYFNLARILSVVAVMFPLATYSSVIEFLRNSDIEENVYKEHLGLLATQQGDIDGVSVERKNVFLVRLSSTYFSLLNATFFARSKKEVTLVRRNRTEKMRGKSVNNNKKICVTQREMTVVQSPNNMNASDKICLTEADDKYMEGFQKMHEEEQQLCYICCNRISNAVIVECGHGGVCSECAAEVIKTKGHCMQCRKEARKVVKIDNSFVGTNIVKGYETITVKEVHVTD